MARPRITLHIYSSLDGRITGKFGKSKQANFSSDLFKQIGFNDNSANSFHFDGWIYGKNSSIDGFNNHEAPDFQEHAPVPAGDFITGLGAKRYYISIDPRGEIGWQKKTESYGGQDAVIIEILSEQTSDDYKDFLRRNGIPYLIAGQKEIAFPLMLEKLSRCYGLKNLLLGGGGILNWNFLTQGLVDEISIVMAPVVDGATNTARLFNSVYMNNSQPIAFKSRKIQTYDDGTLWLRYTPIKPD